ncbi:MAG: NAD(+)/NADH kinase [Candidatus Latescibacteria bacterium]|nr:NAD(+)/NADH kinase [Candidatus Latescibacterota bacterium]
MLELNRVGILLRDTEQDYPLEEVERLFGRQGIEVVLLENTAVIREPQVVDLVVAMGGDGTVLRALDRFPECPVLAINFGTVGFLTAGDRKDLERIIGLLAQGDYLVSERLILQCRYPGGQVSAVNDVIVRTRYHLIFTDVFVNDTKIRTIQGDGVVVGTPTGSTAFLLATGAPIVMPDVRCMVLDGINEYNFSSRSLILAPESEVRLHIGPKTRDPDIYLYVDGRQLGTLQPGQQVHISQASHTAKLIYFDPHFFFHNLTSKLSW